MKRLLAFIPALLAVTVSFAGNHDLHIVTTGDVHGKWFPVSYVDGRSRTPSLMAVKAQVDSIRNAAGADNVLLIDAGDCLQGDNATYYFNNVETGEPHLFPRLASYMGYDAIAVGNHDIEAGHKVYDKVRLELQQAGIPFLGGNAVKEDGDTYFPEYAVIKRAGLKILVAGYTNANIKSWVSAEQWSGMTFEPVLSRIQNSLDRLVAKEKPQVVVVVAHTGTGDGDGSQLENEGLDIFKEIKGVDLLICGHDHRPYVRNKPGFSIVDAGARASNIGHTVISAKTRGRKVIAKEVKAEILRTDKRKIDAAMEEKFRPEFDSVRKFTMREVGILDMELRTRDAYTGMSDYVNLIHTVQLGVPEAVLSLAAPLTFDGKVKAGPVVYNDMFTIYPFENQLFVVNLTGEEIVGIMEYSYDRWIQDGEEHVLKIKDAPDPRTGAAKWSFTGRPYNFDSIAGLIYTVDITKPYGSRISIESLSSGKPFEKDAVYPVAMTSYRANGGGGALPAVGLKAEDVEGRIVARYPEIRDLVYDFFVRCGKVDSRTVGDGTVLGHWKFVPEEIARPALEKDIRLVFPF